QSRGTATVGRIFGPVVLIWFATLAAMGLYQLVQEPSVLKALSPHYGLSFLWNNGWRGFLVLGSVFLVVTGGEALYADMGHFGRKPIQWAWFGLVFPALLLNYLGQGALLLRDPQAISNPFFLMGPHWTLTWIVLSATLATVIASQALISGAFSLSMQAVQLGYLPRLRIMHTSATERGQIYVPNVNWMLMICCVGLVQGFGSSSNLAAAYGVAVTATMLITTVLFCALLIHGWHWRPVQAIALCSTFLLIELAFFAANVVKIPQGGWFPLVIGGVIFLLMSTWKMGRRHLSRLLQARTVPMQTLLDRLAAGDDRIIRVPGTAVFMNGNRQATPPALLANLDHNCILHERVVFLAVETAEQPVVAAAEKVQTQSLSEGFWRVIVRFGYMESPEIPPVLEGLELAGSPLNLRECTFFLGRETVIPRRERFSGMSFWREEIFAVMSRNAVDATAFFALPPDRVIELGRQLEI
ncbi:MAG: KUP/HAK/KT family potassium transporter, partial [Candidatus Eremiobacteraeota bacterium]|nr:KUP/HAK/KT family potassium transporter [Candidatus Eremiobacteraeota bacterium]